MRTILFICCLFIPGTLFANLMPPVTDKSVDLLGHLFGPTMGSNYLGGVANPALLHMFERFNSVVIIIGTTIISYIAIISTINTAQEGQVMGRKWNSIWIPIRSLLGMLLLVPGPTSGYSIIQNMVMWLILNGIGAADMVWNGILDDLHNGASVTLGLTDQTTEINTAQVYDALDILGDDIARATLRSAVCINTIHKIAQGSAKEPVGGFHTPVQSNVREFGSSVVAYETFTSATTTADEAIYSGTLRIGVPYHPQFSDICGHYLINGVVQSKEWDKKIGTPSQDEMNIKAQEIYKNKLWAIRLILQKFTTLANHIADETIQPRDHNQRLTTLPEHPIFPSGYKHEAITIYKETIKQHSKPQQIQSLNPIVRTGKINGWLSAGSFYFSLNQVHPLEFYADILNPIQMQNVPHCDLETCANYSPLPKNIFVPNLQEFLQYGPEINYMATRLWDAKIYLDNDFTRPSDKLNLGQNANNKTAPFHKLQNNMLKLLQDMMSEQHQDPLIAQGRFGSSIMVLSERSWLDTQTELESLITHTEQGYIKATSEVINKIQKLSHKGGLAVAIYGIVWVIGATLAVFVPLLPYLIFTIAVIGWFLLVIEAIVAAPILAISFMLPTGDEMGKVMHGLMLLLNIILRPVLMLFGFVFATRLYQVVVKLVNFGMLANFDYLNTADSLFAWVAVLVMYATFVLTLSNKSFSLIYALPDKILRWLGAMAEHSDPSVELQHAKSNLTKGAETVNKISLGIPERSFARSQNRAKELLYPPDAVREN